MINGARLQGEVALDGFLFPFEALCMHTALSRMVVAE